MLKKGTFCVVTGSLVPPNGTLTFPIHLQLVHYRLVLFKKQFKASRVDRTTTTYKEKCVSDLSKMNKKTKKFEKIMRGKKLKESIGQILLPNQIEFRYFGVLH